MTIENFLCLKPGQLYKLEPEFKGFKSKYFYITFVNSPDENCKMYESIQAMFIKSFMYNTPNATGSAGVFLNKNGSLFVCIELELQYVRLTEIKT